MKRDMICIICPRGCGMTAEICDQQVTVTGNACPKGAEYAKNECLHPVRTVTATVRVANRQDTMVPVKTEVPIPKEHMQEAMTQLRKLSVQAPVALGQVVLEDLFGSRILTTKAVL